MEASSNAPPRRRSEQLCRANTAKPLAVWLAEPGPNRLGGGVCGPAAPAVPGLWPAISCAPASLAWATDRGSPKRVSKGLRICATSTIPAIVPAATPSSPLQKSARKNANTPATKAFLNHIRARRFGAVNLPQFIRSITMPHASNVPDTRLDDRPLVKPAATPNPSAPMTSGRT